MNWDREVWNPNMHSIVDEGGRERFSNIQHTFMELYNSAPISIQVRNMVEAHKLTLNFYRRACRLVPALMNRQGMNYFMDVHRAKLNLANWVRQGKNMRDLDQITKSVKQAYEFLYDCAYSNYESGYYFRYLVSGPEQKDFNPIINPVKMQGINYINQRQFSNKSVFFKKFVKGVKPLLK